MSRDRGGQAVDPCTRRRGGGLRRRRAGHDAGKRDDALGPSPQKIYVAFSNQGNNPWNYATVLAYVGGQQPADDEGQPQAGGSLCHMTIPNDPVPDPSFHIGGPSPGDYDWMSCNPDGIPAWIGYTDQIAKDGTAIFEFQITGPAQNVNAYFRLAQWDIGSHTYQWIDTPAGKPVYDGFTVR